MLSSEKLKILKCPFQVTGAKLLPGSLIACCLFQVAFLVCIFFVAWLVYCPRNWSSEFHQFQELLEANFCCFPFWLRRFPACWEKSISEEAIILQPYPFSSSYIYSIPFLQYLSLERDDYKSPSMVKNFVTMLEP